VNFIAKPDEEETSVHGRVFSPKLELVHPSAFHKEMFRSIVSPPSHKIVSASHNILLFIPIVEGEYKDRFTVNQPTKFG
jgi:hypothetical protein